jgi:hypothetical protein
MTDPLASTPARNLALAAIDEAFQEEIKNCMHNALIDRDIDIAKAFVRIYAQRDQMRKAAVDAFG